MNIVFLCGSLEPGRDGVGDYTRRLAGELLRQGHQAAIIALHDVVEDGQEKSIGTQQDGEQAIPVLCLSSRLSWANRARQSGAFIKAINPDWISLQYVPFSFHEKGLFIGLSNLLKQLSRNSSLHIMFHELWVGMSIQSPRRQIWLGKAQRYLIYSLLATLRPLVVHTHTHLYQIYLAKLGVQAFLLPLFSNIPQKSRLNNNFIPATPTKEHQLKFVIFGGITPGTPVESIAEEVALYTNQRKLAVNLTILGRSGSQQETWAIAWRTCNLAVHILGEQSPVNIADLLSQSSIGLSTTPMILAGKSSAIAAMQAHGLPILCISQPWQPRGISEWQSVPGTFQYTPGNFESFIAGLSNMKVPCITLPSITQQFVNNLLVGSIKGM